MQFYLNSLFCLEVKPSQPKCFFVVITSYLLIDVLIQVHLLSVQTCLCVLSWANDCFGFFSSQLFQVSPAPATHSSAGITFALGNNMQSVMGLWTVLMEVMKAVAVSSSEIFIFLIFLHNKDLYFFLFGSGHKLGYRYWVFIAFSLISYQFTSDLVAELAKFLWEGGLTAMGSLRQLFCFLQLC